MMMNRWKIAVEIDLKKLLIAGVMALSVWLACNTGLGDALLVIIPAGIYGLLSKEV